MASATPSSPSCGPRVFVHNASLLNVDELTSAFGTPLPIATPSSTRFEWLTNSDQHSLGGMVLSRLLHARSCPIAVSPENADVFVVPISPILPRAATPEEINTVHDVMPPSQSEALVQTCRDITQTDWFAKLPELTRRNAARHVFIHPKTFGIYGFCEGTVPGFGEAVRQNPSLQGWVWVGNQVGLRDSDGLHMLSIAFPSSVHMSANDLASPPWRQGRFERTYLAMFGGSMHGSSLARQIRPFLRDACANASRADPSRCKLITEEHMMNSLPAALEAKMQSTFCLEPPGYGLERKSIADALTLGCIPVLFVQPDEDTFWPHHWTKAFLRRSHIYLDGTQVLRGEIDVFEQLRGITSSQVAAMQRAISRHAHQLHVAFDEHYHTARLSHDDAVSRLFRAIDSTASEHARALKVEI